MQVSKPLDGDCVYLVGRCHLSTYKQASSPPMWMDNGGGGWLPLFRTIHYIDMECANAVNGVVQEKFYCIEKGAPDAFHDRIYFPCLSFSA